MSQTRSRSASPQFHDADAVAQHDMIEEMEATAAPATTAAPVAAAAPAVVRMHIQATKSEAHTNGVQAATAAPTAHATATAAAPAQHSSSGASSAPSNAAATAAAAAASSAAAPQTSVPANPHAGALADALLPLLQRVQPDVFLSASPALVEVLTLIQSLPYESKAALFALATANTAAVPAASPSSSSSSSSAPSAAAVPGTLIFRAMLDYFLHDSASGSVHDPVCKFLYDAYWQAATKLGHTAQAADALPSAHLFLLNFLPFLIFKFLAKHYTVAANQSRPASSSSSSSPYAGLFTVFLALYNTERVLAARSGNGGILARPPLPDLPAMRGLVPFDSAQLSAASRNGGAGAASLQLPAISEPTTPHVTTLLHVLLLKMTRSLPSLLPEAREGLVYLAGLTTNSGLLGGADLFAHVLHADRIGPNGNEVAAPSSSSSMPMRWNTNWFHCRSAASSPGEITSDAVTVRYILSPDILQDFVVSLTYALRQDAHLSGPAAEAALWKELALTALRQVHCRAVEEMMPTILLQTTCLLQQEAEIARPPATIMPSSPSPSPNE